MSRMASFLVLTGICLALGFVFYRVMAGFFVPLFCAVITAIVFHPLDQRMLGWFGGRRRISALATTGVVSLVFVVPAAGLVALAGAEGLSLVTRFDAATAKERLARTRAQLGLELPHAEHLFRIESLLQERGALPGESLEDGARGNEDGNGNSGENFSGNDLDLAPSENPQPLFEAVEALASSLTPEEAEKADVEAFLAAINAGWGSSSESERQASLDRIRAGQEFIRFKHDLCGGPFAAWVIDLANPSDARFRRWSARAIDTAKGWLLPATEATAAYLGGILLHLAIFLVATYFFFAEGPAMLAAISALSPLDSAYEQELIREFETVSRAVVLATLLAALAQGLVAGIGYYLAGVPSVVLLTTLTAVLALVPFVGATAVWAPVCLWLWLFEDRPGAAALLAVYGATIVGTVDNLVKPLVLHGRSNLHPLAALLSVLGGVQALGAIGILIGPMIVALLQTLLKILQRELVAWDRSAAANLATAGGSMQSSPMQSSPMQSHAAQGSAAQNSQAPAADRSNTPAPSSASRGKKKSKR